MFKKITLSLAVSVAMLAPVAAMAQSGAPEIKAVQIKDLDLTTSKDQARLDSRVRSAARQICVIAGDRTLAARTKENACVERAIVNSRNEVKLAIADALRHAMNTHSNASKNS